MSVNPGFGGQQFIEDTVNKVAQASAIRESLALNFTIQVDGGVNLDNCARLKSAGADNLVAGSAVFQVNESPRDHREAKIIYMRYHILSDMSFRTAILFGCLVIIGSIESYGQFTIQGEVKAYDGKPLSDILVAAPEHTTNTTFTNDKGVSSESS